MRYVVIVGLVFATERTSQNKYDVWDLHIAVETDGPRTALYEAISRSKKFEEWKELGYSDVPVICGVRAIHDAPPAADVSQEGYLRGRLPILVGTIDEKMVRQLKSFDAISVPYTFMEIDESK